MSRVLSPGEVGRLVDVTAQLGPWAMPVVEALKSGIIAIQFLHRADRAPLGDMRRSALPLLSWIGDDDDTPTGPDGWRSALPTIRWARSAILHAAGGESAHYASAVMGALATGRLLLVETSTVHVQAWAAALAGTPTLVVVPRDGKPHPVHRRETRH